MDINVNLLKNSRTKIIATLGPSSDSIEVICSLIEAGADVFRLNFSHGTHETHRATFENIHTAAQRKGRIVAVLADLCGPKIRAGLFRGGRIELVAGEKVVVTTRDVLGEPGLIPSQYRELSDDVRPGERILLDDGNIELTVESISGTEISCRVVNGGPLKDKKGINLPGVAVSAPALTPKDEDDARFALGLGVDYLALSFVRRKEDVTCLRKLVEASGRSTGIICKIEKPEALDNIDGILEASDGIMVARGDLGVELPPQKVPEAQAELIDLARRARKPVIVATQMMESMIEHPRPTRAEVSDVANAAVRGVDAVMLSGETAAGKYPVEVVRMMDAVIRQTEAYLWKKDFFQNLSLPPLRKEGASLPLVDAISEATAQLSRSLLVRAVVVMSESGYSTALMSSCRPAAPVLGVSPEAIACRKGCLCWGVLPVLASRPDMEDACGLARRLVLQLGLAEVGERILLVRGFHMEVSCSMPTVTVVTV
ncbi:MAG: pyruvate kinase [Planctomycetes bacterium]|nr:pyruvate kinase [Planctomycetota bacterium]